MVAFDLDDRIFEALTDDEKARALDALEKCARRLGLWEARTWGPRLEDRESQITFSALGQQAPGDAKRAWDPTGEKKLRLRAEVAALLPDLEARAGGTTSIDITRVGRDKSFGIARFLEITGLSKQDVLFYGDRLDEQGNDYPVKATGVPCVAGWQDTAARINDLLDGTSPPEHGRDHVSHPVCPSSGGHDRVRSRGEPTIGQAHQNPPQARPAKHGDAPIRGLQAPRRCSGQGSPESVSERTDSALTTAVQRLHIQLR